MCKQKHVQEFPELFTAAHRYSMIQQRTAGPLRLELCRSRRLAARPVTSAKVADSCEHDSRCESWLLFFQSPRHKLLSASHPSHVRAAQSRKWKCCVALSLLPFPIIHTVMQCRERDIFVAPFAPRLPADSFLLVVSKK